MRLLCTIENDSQGLEFSQFLKNQGIANDCEVLSVSDWGSETYGNRFCRIWIVDEDQVAQAEKFHEEFLANPTDPKFKEKQPNLIKQILEPEAQKAVAKEGLAKIQKAASSWQSQPVGAITLWLMILCTFLFIWGATTMVSRTVPAELAPIAYLTSSPIHQELLYDYPKAYEIVDRLVRLYDLGQEDRVENSLPPEASYLLEQYHNTPIWNGLYPKLVLALKGQKDKIDWNQPVFEKIREGEVWRTITPSFLHTDLIHLFFNVIWLLVLGKQIEHRIGAGRYILFIIIAAIFSNTLQYLMGGPLFMGFSGVVCAMLGFIYMRQRLAAWEGYQLQRVTLGFLAFFIFTMLAIQVVSFFGEVYWNMHLAPRIANTAHLAGLAMGLLMGKLDYFAWKKG
ncbi:MAG: rhomboid family intramembrane serine protease [Chlamydiales bacterium]|nr:rhomboid family intramembrane serine protease [Chlamydiales bacterium]